MAFRSTIFCVLMGVSVWTYAENISPTETSKSQEKPAAVASQPRLYVPIKDITVRNVEDVQKILAAEIEAAKQRNKH
ncbi:MAG: hypothetical protein KAJ19_02565 [Gammaproteobacteria bacterium]|nr:hypothetical protein [Gammaproteobacteria bacterium]